MGMTPNQITALQALQGQTGADVYDRTLAVAYRELADMTPPLVLIVKAKTKPAGFAQQPYFGVTLTAKGKRIAAQTKGGKTQ